MSSRNYLFPSLGTRAETNVARDIIEEAIRSTGQEIYYIPRKLVAFDKILGEDRLSEFKGSFRICAYLEQVEGFGGAGPFMSKFGYNIEEQATFVVGRLEWEKSVGRYGDTILPSRPCEGDLLWFPIPNALFEIMFVDHQGEGVSGFYQLGKLYVYRLKCELFRYSSEKVESGIAEVDAHAAAQTFDLLGVDLTTEDEALILDEDGAPILPGGFREKDEQNYDRSEDIKEAAKDVISDLDDIKKNPFADF